MADDEQTYDPSRFERGSGRDNQTMLQVGEDDRTPEEVARSRAAADMEYTLVEQEQSQERGTGAPIAEQADGDRPNVDNGSDMVTAGQGTGSAGAGQNADGTGDGIVSPGQGTDPTDRPDGSGA